ncbi:DUF1295 domain-containing protein [Flammeovirga pectinis]|uniref:DUF1295 domain-containing protein n=1 Tax=Flammeovirga pectinis TaxID=2494373 RepID=A0A3S9P7V8_9BACT|nr:DUF1295 domain-containing protein [Flammeovirga pectinis]AZQ64295.1 DUF1295 domain-containing protein [Flammeovirga pectinis]
MKVSTYINAHKILLIPVVLFLMWYFNNWSTEAFIYLAIHGTYCLLWLLKHNMFPDNRFSEKQPFLIGLFFIFLPLGGYYIAPYLLISNYVVLPPYLFVLVVFIYTLGIFLHYVSDAQKYFTLKLQKGLINEGLFTKTRNPNYLGEILIYSAYAIMAMHWIPWLVLSGWVFGFFLKNMIKKDKSISRHEGFINYKKKSWLLFPKP